MNCNSCPESKLALKDGEPAEMVMDPNSETCKSCMDELIKDTIERHKESLDMLAEDDGLMLKPCPFCGSTKAYCEKDFFVDPTIICPDCGMGIFSISHAEDMVKKWNRRVKE